MNRNNQPQNAAITNVPKYLSVPILKPALGNPAVHRRLAALEAWSLPALASLGPLVSVSASLPSAGSVPPPDTLPVFGGARIWREVVKAERFLGSGDRAIVAGKRSGQAAASSGAEVHDGWSCAKCVGSLVYRLQNGGGSS